MANTVANQFVETLATAGVKRIYGVVGDSLNGLTDALRRQGKIEWVHVCHQEVGAFAAGAEASAIPPGPLEASGPKPLWPGRRGLRLKAAAAMR